MKLESLSPKPFLLILGEDYKLLVKYLCRYGSISSLVLIHFPLFQAHPPLPYPRAKKYKIWSKKKIEPQHKRSNI